MKASWSGVRLGGRRSAEDSRVVAVTGTPEALVAGKPEVLRAIMEIPEVVDVGIPKVSTILSGGCLGGRPRADAWAVIAQGNWKRWETEARWHPGPGPIKLLTACVVEEVAVGGVQSSLLKLLLALLLVGWVLADGELRLAAVACDV